jgi:hypothetical protein
MSIGEHILYRSAHFGALFYLVLFGEFAKLVVDETGKPQRDRSAHVLSVGIRAADRPLMKFTEGNGIQPSMQKSRLNGCANRRSSAAVAFSGTETKSVLNHSFNRLRAALAMDSGGVSCSAVADMRQAPLYPDTTGITQLSGARSSFWAGGLHRSLWPADAGAADRRNAQGWRQSRCPFPPKPGHKADIVE